MNVLKLTSTFLSLSNFSVTEKIIAETLLLHVRSVGLKDILRVNVKTAAQNASTVLVHTRLTLNNARDGFQSAKSRESSPRQVFLLRRPAESMLEITKLAAITTEIIIPAPLVHQPTELQSWNRSHNT